LKRYEIYSVSIEGGEVLEFPRKDRLSTNMTA
jgi:hypothetical protein